MAAHAELAIIGGSGLYALMDDVRAHPVETPYGEPSDPIMLAEVDGRSVAFLPRHGRDHRHPPHLIPYRANMWALRSIGVRQILAPCAVGGLRPEFGPGAFVVPDQMIDRTSGRIQTYFDRGAVHVPFADPYCPTGRATVLDTARREGISAHDGGTMVVVEGPRFSTRAESQWYASAGGSIINMTGHPEAVLARELALCYTSVALVTDYDAGVESGQGVTQDEVFKVFAENISTLRDLLLRAIAQLPTGHDCRCRHSLDGITLPLDLP
ncbi:S-methyl-5'-thioadenosine phosphorylase [Plantactinospora sp. GCM10030261]|uniref:S-methyl-5'-thioadenosine phosphorylase n=1 Tax=Plantactinospora sp. GCM10030261 TaxID=3273420 RepID=UPI003616E507